MALALKEAASAVTCLAIVGGGALGMNELHEPRGEVEKVRAEFHAETAGLQADLRVDRIRSLVRESRDENGPVYLCDAIDAEIIALCSENKDHYLCSDSVIRQMKAKAGCDD